MRRRDERIIQQHLREDTRRRCAITTVLVVFVVFCSCRASLFFAFFFFNDTATTEIYTLSLHDALPIWVMPLPPNPSAKRTSTSRTLAPRSEEHTSELQSRLHLVCRLLLEKKKQED